MSAPRALADLAARLAELEAIGRRRALEAGEGAQGPIVEMGGERLLNFCSNDYLGLASHPEVREALCAGVARHGVGSGAAALLSGRSRAHAELEDALARALGRERALLFSSGYLANIGLVTTLVGRHDLVLHDRLNHASLIDAVRLAGAEHRRYPHADAGAVGRLLAARGERRAWVVTDTVFSMDGDLAPLPALARACADHDAALLCDDAHGFGVLGGGRGALAACGIDEHAAPAVVVTFGKALGTAGAAVAGSATLVEALIQGARTFIYDTAPPPALAVATRVALGLALDDAGPRLRLEENVRYFRERLAASGLPVPASTSPIQPIVLGADAAALDAAARLRARGLYVRAVRPPTVPPGTARLRICLSAAHEPGQIDRLVAALSTLDLPRPEAA